MSMVMGGCVLSGRLRESSAVVVLLTHGFGVASRAHLESVRVVLVLGGTFDMPDVLVVVTTADGSTDVA